MATLTIRNVPEDLVERIKGAAARNGRSMESEVRELLARQFARSPESRAQVLERIRQLTAGVRPPTARQIRRWIETGRENPRTAVTFGRFNRIERRKGEWS
jgi:plasmid stability protein